MTFYVCIYTCLQNPDQHMEHFYHSRSFTCVPFQLVSQPVLGSDQSVILISLAYLKLYVMDSYILFCLWLLALNIIIQIYQNSYLYPFLFHCEVVFHCVNIEKYIHSAIDGHLNNLLFCWERKEIVTKNASVDLFCASLFVGICTHFTWVYI